MIDVYLMVFYNYTTYKTVSEPQYYSLTITLCKCMSWYFDQIDILPLLISQFTHCLKCSTNRGKDAIVMEINYMYMYVMVEIEIICKNS